MEQPIQKNVGEAIVEAACNPDSKDLAVKWLDLDSDFLTKEGVLTEFPVVKTMLAILKTGTAIRDRLFLHKVGGFILGCPKFTEANRQKFARDHLSDPKKAKRLCDAIVLILDKLDDLEKTGIVAKVFAALVLGKIDEKTFRQLAAAIDIGFLEDLVALSQDHASQKPKLMRSLLRTGLVEIDEERDSMKVGQLAGRSLGLAYKINELGQSFIECLNCPNC